MLTVSLSLTGTCDLKCHFGTLEPDACSAGDSNADCLTFFNRDV